MSEDKDNLICYVSMHGIEKEDVKATIKFNSPSLVIDAEKVMKDFKLIKYSIKFDIPNHINVTGIKQVMEDGVLKTLCIALAFCSSDLVLRFAVAFWLCVLLIEDSSCVLPREDSASFKTWFRFVSDLVAFCLEDFLHFISRPPAFCLKTWMHFVSRPPAFCLKGVAFCILASYVLSTIEDLLYGGGAIGYGGVQNIVGNDAPGQARSVKCYNCNGAGHIARNRTQPKRPQNFEYYKDKMLLMQAQENEVALDAEQMLFLAKDCDAFDFDVDEAPSTQTMFMANLSSTDLVTDEARRSYDLDILFEVQDHDHYQDAVCACHEEYTMHDNAQLNHDVDSHTEHTSDSNMISYDQYVKDNAVSVVHSGASSVPNDAFMMLCNDMYEPHIQSVSNLSWNKIVENSLTVELATYKEQVKLYERQAKFKLTEQEQKINEQLRLVISNRNFKEETLKKEFHSIKLQLTSTINHNKSMVEEVKLLKRDFKQKENKYLEDFLDMKPLKEKAEDRLFKQDQSLQTVYMLCRPTLYYNELTKVAIGYKNPSCLTQDTLEIAEITRKKMKDPECMTHKVKIAPHNYSKENFLATFTPQKQLTPEQIFWSQYLIKLKFEALKEKTTVSKPIKALTVYPPNTSATLVPQSASNKESTEAIQADCDVKATNIIFQVLPLKIYALVSTRKVAKDLWERIQMLMQGTSLTKQERECKLYDAFDKFTYQKGETLRDFYLRFSLLLNEMNMYNMKLE
nr:hypothetical protein [Tanacetum cinerariifolium]